MADAPFIASPQDVPFDTEAFDRIMRARIAAGRAEIEAGNYLELEELEAWLDSGPETPMPDPKRISLPK
jgi:predicted transcriptional regulator